MTQHDYKRASRTYKSTYHDYRMTQHDYKRASRTCVASKWANHRRSGSETPPAWTNRGYRSAPDPEEPDPDQQTYPQITVQEYKHDYERVYLTGTRT